MSRCASCQAPITPAMRFCGSCGKPIPPAPASPLSAVPPEAEDLTVTAVSLPPHTHPGGYVPPAPTSAGGVAIGNRPGSHGPVSQVPSDDQPTPIPGQLGDTLPAPPTVVSRVNVPPPGGDAQDYSRTVVAMPTPPSGFGAGLGSAAAPPPPGPSLPNYASAPPAHAGQPIFESVPGAPPARPAPVRTAPEVSLLQNAELGRFVPGTLLGGRYRIVGRLGKGGMGDVYRAEDLKLGQTCAMKFLPETLATDRAALLRLFNEVKVARQVSHPNVCRVYDLGEADGVHFISMEYVDGEDLASLLRRIGRLPGDKALQVARQLCAGLAAAHEKGVLHRDLKPANIMIDGRGHVRIMDFGLAGLAEELKKDSGRAGTPAYMAPEQLAGKGVSAKSDVFALGLLLFEIFSGRPMFRPESMADLARMHKQPLPTLRSVVPEADTRVEEVIVKCLERDVELRPASALAVAALLPGGDALAAAVAAGETPSPAMVAASGKKGSLLLPIAAALLVALIAGVFAVAALNQNVKRFAAVPLDRSPDSLADQAREILDAFGQPAPGAVSDAAYGFTDSPPPAAASAPGLTFWYRRSSQSLLAGRGPGAVTPTDPPLSAGSALLLLDSKGRLLELTAPLAPGASAAASATEPDFPAALRALGVDPAAAKPVSTTGAAPPVFASRVQVWEAGNPPQRFLTAANGSAVVYAGPLPSSASPGATAPPAAAPASEPTPPAATGAEFLIGLALYGAVIGVPAVLAFWNLRQGRVDQRSALRLALIVTGIDFLSWLLAAHVPSDAGAAGDQMLAALAQAVFTGVMALVAYLALEPLIRRRWPQSLVSWSRLLGGQWRDPLIGRELLLGAVLGLLWVLLAQGLFLTAKTAAPRAIDTAALLGPLPALGVLLGTIKSALLYTLAIALLCTIPRLFVRNPTVALAAQFVVLAVAFALALLQQTGATGNAVVALAGLLAGCIAAAVLARAGLLTLGIAFVIASVLWNMPLALGGPSWYAGSSILAMAVVILTGGLGFWISLGRRPAPRSL